jgi:hypothetical protein
MPIYRLFQGKAFEPEHCAAMGLAFEAVLAELGLACRSDPLCELVARKVIQLGERGVKDCDLLQELALAEIRTCPMESAA